MAQRTARRRTQQNTRPRPLTKHFISASTLNILENPKRPRASPQISRMSRHHGLIPLPFHAPWLWLFALIIWASILWFLSGGPPPITNEQGFPHLDKILHFGYFFGGAGLLSAFLWLHSERRCRLPQLILLNALILGAYGAIDEWHQTFTEGLRTGADLADWLADLAGALIGPFVFWALRHRAFGKSPSK